MRHSAFARYWLASAVSSLGTAVTAVAMPVLVVQLLEATPLEVGIVNAAQFLPYALLGLLAGVYTDRWRRKPVLVAASVGRAVSLAAIPLLWMLGILQIWMLVVLLLVFGAFAVFGFAASQSLLPRIVPRGRLVPANARLDQADATAQTLGPVVGGGLVTLLGGPLAILVDAISYVVEACLNAGIRIDEPTPERAARNLRREIADGLRWMYRHRVLGPLAGSTHLWFLANGIALTALSLLALRSFGLSPFTYGLLLAASGVAGLIGATSAPSIGARLGAGRAVVIARATYPLAWLLVALSSATTAGMILLFTALALHGFLAGMENANEMGLRQGLTPDALLGRTNATGRAVNRTSAALGALLGGAAIGLLGGGPVLVIVIVLFALAAMVGGLSPLRHAVVEA